MTIPAVASDGLVVTLGGTTILAGVSVTVRSGAWLAVIGPNGAGKSTLLRALAGLVAAEGTVTLRGQALADLSRRQRARCVALVPQDPVIPPGMAVVDYVCLGRTPYISSLGRESATDLDAVHGALSQLDLLGFASRRLETLSGGERQRVLIARALAQTAPIPLLDEPTSALDVGHQQEVLELVDELRRVNDLTIVSTMHDLTLAGQYADSLVLLDHGTVVATCTPETVLTEQNLTRFYGARVRIVRDNGSLAVVPIRPASA
ncbi:ABC transporter ATP-binding protein [soil metagenome]